VAEEGVRRLANLLGDNHLKLLIDPPPPPSLEEEEKEEEKDHQHQQQQQQEEEEEISLTLPLERFKTWLLAGIFFQRSENYSSSTK